MLIILNLTFLMQEVLSATLSRLCPLLGDFHMSIHGHLAAKPFTSFFISTLVPLARNLPVTSHFTEWLKKVRNSGYHCSEDSKPFSTLA